MQGSKGAIWEVPGTGYVFGKPDQEAQPIAAVDARPATVDRLIAVIQGKVPAAELAADLRACEDAVAIMAAAYAANASGQWAPVGDASHKAK